MFRSIILGSAIWTAAQAAVAAYFLENNPAGSNIVSFQLKDGLPSSPVRTSTGGKGSFQVTSTGQPAQADTLGSQSAVFVEGNNLFTVNAGSNTLSYFDIDPRDPYHPKLVRTVDTLGEFPISVTYSDRLSKVCVLNGGAKSGVACFDLYGHPDGPLRSIPLNETTPPSGPPGSAAQVGFNGDKLIATIKNLNGGPGSLVVFEGFALQQKRIYQNPNIPGDFGFANLNSSAILLSDIADAWIVDIESFTAQHVDIGNASAACWSIVSGSTGYISDAGESNVYVVAGGKLQKTLSIPASGGGVFDSVVADGKLSALVVANGIVSVDLSSGKQTFLDLSSFGTRQQYQGLAVWPDQGLDMWPNQGPGGW